MRREGLIVDWYDRNISAGKEWEHEIDTHLNTSQIILLLISPDFLASDYCYSSETKRALEKHEAGEARVIPILLKPADWQNTPLRKLQTLPKDAKAVSKWRDKGDAFIDIAKGIREALKDLKSQQSFTASPSTTAAEEAITSSSDDPSSLDFVTPEVHSPISELAPVWNVPYRRNPLFTGRNEVLQRLHDTFNADTPASSPQSQLLSGLGGMGKTQTAIEYAHSYHDDYHVVLWAKADSREVLTSDFASFAGLLNLPGQHEQDLKYAVDAVKRWLELNTNWLLILDNVEDLKMVYDFLPAAPKGHIILTSRTQVTGGIAFRLELENMTPAEGASFLLRRISLVAPHASLDDVFATDRVKAAEIATEMDGLPLAIDQAGAYIEETSCGLSAYLELYRKRRGELLRMRGGLASDHPEPVATTWSLSFEKIEQTNPAAAELLRFFAFLHPDSISEELILRGASQLGSLLQTIAIDTFMLNEAIRELHKYSLVRRNPEAMLTVHRLVQTVLKEKMSKKTYHQWAERTVRAVNQAFPDVEFKTWHDCRQFLPHAQICAVLIKQEGMIFPAAARLLNEAGYYLYEQGQYPEAEPLLEQAVAIREQTLGLEHLDLATSLNNLAELYRGQGKYTQAEPLYQRALTIRETLLGPEHVDLATSLNNLGLLYDDQAKYPQAKPLHQRALEIRQNLLGMNHSDTATSLNNLALLYQDEGLYAQARPLFQQALTIKEQALGPEHPDTAATLNNLAALYKEEGQYAQARPLLQRALAIREKVLGPEHPDTAAGLNNLAALYQVEGLYAQARPLLQRALAIREKVLGPEHPDTVISLSSLAGFYAVQGNYAQAESYFKQALSICERKIETEQPLIIDILKNYATMLRNAKRNTKAQELEIRIKMMEAKRVQQNPP